MSAEETTSKLEVDLTTNPLVRGAYLKDGEKVFFEMRAVLLIEAVNEYVDKNYTVELAKVQLS